MKNRKIIFIILLALDIAYTYLAIKGKAHFFHGYTRDSFLLYILRYIVHTEIYSISIASTSSRYTRWETSKHKRKQKIRHTFGSFCSNKPHNTNVFKITQTYRIVEYKILTTNFILDIMIWDSYRSFH